jgi:hypothetical protein
MRALRKGGILAPLLGLALGGAANPPAARAFEVYCVPAGVNTLACQRLDEVGTSQVVTCVDDVSNIRTCTTPEGEVRSCVRSRGNVFSCEKPVDGSAERSRCQATGSGVYACDQLPQPAPQALPVVGPLEEDGPLDGDPDQDLDGDLDRTLMRDGLDD